MGTRTRTAITIETERVVSIHWHRAPLVSWCDRCQAQVPMMTAQQAGWLLQVSALTLQQLIEAEQLHFLMEYEGLLLICLHSLYHLN